MWAKALKKNQWTKQKNKNKSSQRWNIEDLTEKSTFHFFWKPRKTGNTRPTFPHGHNLLWLSRCCLSLIRPTLFSSLPQSPPYSLLVTHPTLKECMSIAIHIADIPFIFSLLPFFFFFANFFYINVTHVHCLELTGFTRPVIKNSNLGLSFILFPLSQGCLLQLFEFIISLLTSLSLNT